MPGDFKPGDALLKRIFNMAKFGLARALPKEGGRGGDDLVLRELCNCQRDGFIQGFSLHVSRMDY